RHPDLDELQQRRQDGEAGEGESKAGDEDRELVVDLRQVQATEPGHLRVDGARQLDRVDELAVQRQEVGEVGDLELGEAAGRPAADHRRRELDVGDVPRGVLDVAELHDAGQGRLEGGEGVGGGVLDRQGNDVRGPDERLVE